MILLSTAWALTLEEAVARAGEVDPSALVARLTADQSRFAAAESWSANAPTVAAATRRSWSRGVVSDASSLTASVPLIDAGNLADALQDSAVARGSTLAADATRLDAQYATAALYFEVLAGRASVEAARAALASAEVTARNAQARVAAGMDSELVGRSAELGVLEARASLARAEARQWTTRARLQRALELEELGEVAPAPLPPLDPPPLASPWLAAQAKARDAAVLGHTQRLLELLPTGNLSVSTNLLPTAGTPSFGAWTVAFGATWRFDGLLGPWYRERQARLDVRIAEVQLDALERDLRLGMDVAHAEAAAADLVADAAEARVHLSEEALAVGQARLDAGLAATIEVLRLQDDAAKARADRVDADLLRALARLEARRLAGVGW